MWLFLCLLFSVDAFYFISLHVCLKYAHEKTKFLLLASYLDKPVGLWLFPSLTLNVVLYNLISKNLLRTAFQYCCSFAIMLRKQHLGFYWFHDVFFEYRIYVGISIWINVINFRLFLDKRISLFIIHKTRIKSINIF